MAIYSEYIRVDEDFIPVFDEGWDRKYPQRWKSFYPHGDFLSILEAVVRTLEGSRNEERKSLWVSGAYGTGKTFASFVIQHLLEDAPEEVADYFETHRLDKTLLNRLLGLRRGKNFLIVRRSSSSSITGDYLLFGALQDSIVESLKKKNLPYLGTKSLYTEVVERLSNPDSPFNFRGIFKRVQSKFFPEYQSPEEVIQNLRAKGFEQNQNLLRRIIALLLQEKQHLTADPQKIRSWIADVIQGNGVDALLFIWDEFSDYFRQNRAVTGLQEVAQVSSTAPFYFLLITHKDYNQFLSDESDRKRIEDRFKIHHLRMSEPTALQLIANVIKARNQKEKEWEELSKRLWALLSGKIPQLLKLFIDDIPLETFKKLVPIHPYTAALLGVLSWLLSSNQRTMFQFLSGKSPQDSCNFRWFIDNHDFQTKPFLTGEALWDYFFTQNETEIPPKMRWIVNRFETLKPKLQNEQQRVLKMVFLLFAVKEMLAVQRFEGHSLVQLLTPKLSNLSLAFAGTELEASVRILLDKLVEQKIVWQHQEEDDCEYFLQADISDTRRYEEILQHVQREKTFEKILQETTLSTSEGEKRIPDWILERLSPLYLAERFHPFEVYSRKTWKRPSFPQLGHIACTVLFVEKSNDIVGFNEEIHKRLADINFDYVVIDASSVPFGEERLKEYWEQEALERYFRNVDGRSDHIKPYQERRRNIVEEWLKKLQNASLRVYFRREAHDGSWTTETKNVEGLEELAETLSEIDAEVFFWGLEAIAEHQSLFKSSGFGKEVVKMGTGVTPISGRYRYLEDLLQKLQSTGLWEKERYWEEETKDPIAQAIIAMKKRVEEVVSRSFQEKRSVTIREIYVALQEKPFGFLGWVGYTFLLGFLLRNYCQAGRYYRYDGKSTVLLNEDTLADMIMAAMRSNDASSAIVEMTREQDLFCAFAEQIFPIPKNQCYSIKSIQNAIRDYLSRAGFPLWAARFLPPQAPGSGETFCRVVELFCRFVASHYQTQETEYQSKEEIRIAEQIAQEIAQMSDFIFIVVTQKLPTREEALESQTIQNFLEKLYEAFRSDSLKKGLQAYLAREHEPLLELAQKMGFEGEALLRIIRKRVSTEASWLWVQEDFTRKIQELTLDLRLFAVLQETLRVEVQEDETDKVETYLKRFFQRLRLPHRYFAEVFPEKIIKTCQDIKLTSKDKEELLQELKARRDILSRLFKPEGCAEVLQKKSQEILGVALSLEEAEELYRLLPEGQFLLSEEKFAANLREVWLEYQANSTLKLLQKRWQELSGTPTPRAWSYKHRIPIFWVLGEEPRVMHMCEALEKKRKLTAEELEEIKDFLESPTLILLSDPQRCNAYFLRRLFLGREPLSVLSKEVEKLKEYIAMRVPQEPYDWYQNPQEVYKAAHEYWAKLYRERYAAKVLEKIEKMDGKAIKTWLKERIMQDPWMGMEILGMEL